MTFVVIGDTNADIRGSLDAFPKEGDDTTVRESSWHSGGSGANVAVALAKLGAKVRLVSRVGVDPAAEIALEAARKAGVDLTHVQRDQNTPTGLCFAAISPNGERTLFGFRGANPLLEAVDPSVLDGATWLVVSGHALIENPQCRSTIDLILEAGRRGVHIALDLCLPLMRLDVGRDIVRAGAQGIAVLLGNQQELALLGQDRAKFPIIVEKLGAEGARLSFGGGEGIRHDTFPIEARDTTACGDAFVAGFVFAMANSQAAFAAVDVGNTVGALTAMRFGAADSTPSLDEVRALLDTQHSFRALCALNVIQRSQ